MTRLVSAYRTTETREITQDAADVSEAREHIEKQVPPGYELIKLDVGKTETGSRVTGIIRSSETTPIEATGTNYAEARSKLREQIPEGNVGLGILIAED